MDLARGGVRPLASAEGLRMSGGRTAVEWCVCPERRLRERSRLKAPLCPTQVGVLLPRGSSSR